MSSAASRLRVSNREGVTRIEFVDRNILDEANIQQIGDEITEIIESADEPKVLISFENVEHLSSAALGTLITVNNQVKARDGQLRLSDISPQIKEIFSITRLDRLFQIHDTSDAAMATFG